MSEITLFQQAGNLAIPEYLKTGTDDLTKRLAGGMEGAAISIRGGIWRMKAGGEEISKNEARALNFVVLNAAPHISRAYYADKYQAGVETPPSCFSGDGVRPDGNVPDEARQSKDCASCPQNIAGSGDNGTRACRFNQRLAVVLEGDVGGTVFRIQLPAKSLFGKAEGDKMPFQAYAKFLAGHGIPISGVVTEARFDSDESVPVIKFRAVRPLTQAEFEVAKAQAQSKGALQAIDTTIVLKESKAAPEAAPPAFQAAAPAEPAVRRNKPKDAAAPTEKISKAAILEQWGSDDDD